MGMNDNGHSTREILESIAAEALESIGYEVSTNIRRTNKDGTDTEVDVWAISPKKDLSVYISCKNWNQAIGGPEVDNELGRVSNLKTSPNLKLLIAPGFRGRAKTSAHANGFITIEIAEKAERKNSEEIASRIKSIIRGNLNFPDKDLRWEHEFQACDITKLEILSFQRRIIEGDDKSGISSTVLWDCEDIRPVQIIPVMNVLDEFYGKNRTEYIDDFFHGGSETLFHIFDRGGVVAVEDYNRNLLGVRILSEDRAEFLHQVGKYDSEMYGGLYRALGMEDWV